MTFASNLLQSARPVARARLHLLLDDLGQADPDKPIKIEIPPQRCEVEWNAYSEADTFSLEFFYGDFPLDPRIVRACNVELFLADAGDDPIDFFSNIAGSDLRDYCLIAGVADEIENTFDERGYHTVITGRDYTAYFIDAEVEDKEITFREKESGKKLTLLQVIESLVKLRDTTENIQVVADSDVLFEPLYPADYLSTLQDGVRKPRQGESTWDLVQELALEAGVLAYIEKDILVVRKPTTLYVDQAQYPDAGYHWTLGHDLLSYQPKRELARQAGIRVAVTSKPDGSKEPIQVKYPPDEDLEDTTKAKQTERIQIAASPIGQDAKKTTSKSKTLIYRPFVVRGIASKERLEKIAREIHAQLLHGEMEVMIRTGQMYDTRGRPVQSMRFGDPVTIQVRDGFENFLTLDQGQMIGRLTTSGWEPVDAEKYAQALVNTFVPFYLYRATHSWGARDGEGYELTMELRGRRQIRVEG